MPREEWREQRCGNGLRLYGGEQGFRAGSTGRERVYRVVLRGRIEAGELLDEERGGVGMRKGAETLHSAAGECFVTGAQKINEDGCGV